MLAVWARGCWRSSSRAAAATGGGVEGRGGAGRGRVPVVVLNACQSGAMGKELEASVATALLRAGCAAVVAMAYSVYAVAAAEFMAAFYESLFAGDSVGQAVTAGRKRLFEHDGRPSPKGDMPLADWLVPVHYLRREVRFPRPARPGRRAAVAGRGAGPDPCRPSGAGARRIRWLRPRRVRGPRRPVLPAGGRGPAAAGGGAARAGRDGQDGAGQGVRPVVARHRRGR